MYLVHEDTHIYIIFTCSSMNGCSVILRESAEACRTPIQAPQTQLHFSWELPRYFFLFFFSIQLIVLLSQYLLTRAALESPYLFIFRSSRTQNEFIHRDKKHEGGLVLVGLPLKRSF